jgi:hypothetical protein
MKVGDALMSVKDKFINYILGLSKIEGKYKPDEINTINDAINNVKNMGIEALITYISMFIIPSYSSIDLFIRSRISEDFLKKLSMDELNKVKRYLLCMADLVNSK